MFFYQTPLPEVWATPTPRAISTMDPGLGLSIDSQNSIDLMPETVAVEIVQIWNLGNTYFLFDIALGMLFVFCLYLAIRDITRRVRAL